MENRLPWQPHTMSPLSTPATVHPLCVHVALNALNCPLLGCVSTTASVAKTVPPPTGTSSTLAIRWPAGLVGGGFFAGDVRRFGAGCGGAAADVAGTSGVAAPVVGPAVGEAVGDGGIGAAPVPGTGAGMAAAATV